MSIILFSLYLKDILSLSEAQLANPLKRQNWRYDLDMGSSYLRINGGKIMTHKPEPAGRRPPPGLFARLLDSLQDVFTLVLDKERRIVYANASFLEHFGLEWPAVTGQVCFDLESSFKTTAGEEMGFCPRELGPYFPAHHVLTREVDGKKFIYEGTFYHVVRGEEEAWTVCTFRDVTLMFNLECQVRQMDELERMLAQASIDGIVVNDLLGNVLIFNEGAARILGYRPEEVIGQLKVSVLYPEGQAHEIKELIYSSAYGGPGILENYETLARHKDGTLIPVWLSSRLLREDGLEVGIVGYFRDLRERKRLEEELLRQERLATLGKMAAHVSHEIKNPLMLIGGFARQVLKDIAQDPQKNLEKLRIIVDEVKRLEDFLIAVGSYAKFSEPHKEPGDLNVLIQETCLRLEPSMRESNIGLSLALDLDLPQVQFDPIHLRQVILNIAKNGLEAMEAGGTLTITTGRQEGRVFVQICDTGPGIPQEVREKIFEPFFSSKPKGSGLGLAISQKIIEAHQGEIAIESELQKGTRVTISLKA